MKLFSFLRHNKMIYALCEMTSISSEVFGICVILRKWILPFQIYKEKRANRAKRRDRA